MVLLRGVLRVVGLLQRDTRVQFVQLARTAVVASLLFWQGPLHAREITLCYREDAAPFSSGPAAEPRGYSVDLCRDAARLAGYDVIGMYPVNIENRFTALKGEKCRLLCGATTVTMARRDEFEFSLMIFVTDTAILYPRGRIGGASGRSLSLGYLKDTTTHENVDSGRFFGGDSVAIEFVPFASHDEALRRLESGEVDGYVADREILFAMLQGSPALGGTHEISRHGLSYEPYALVARHGDHEIIAEMDRALAKLFRNGRAKELVSVHVPSRIGDEFLETLFEIQSIPEGRSGKR